MCMGEEKNTHACSFGLIFIHLLAFTTGDGSRKKEFQTKHLAFHNHQPPFPPFFFFCCCFFFVPAAPTGFWCLGGIILPVDEDGTVVVMPGLGDVGGLLAVLLASLQTKMT